MNDCAFFNSSANSNGGAIYISSSKLAVNLTRCCFFQCDIKTNGEGTSLSINTGTNNYLLKLNMVTFSRCGLSSYGLATIRLNGAQHHCHALNFSNNKDKDFNVANFICPLTSIYQYLNLFNNTASGSYIVQFYPTNYVDLDYSNIINNYAQSYGIHSPITAYTRILIKYCIFIGNSGMSYLFCSPYGYTQTYRYCFIRHTGTISLYFTNDNSIETISLSTESFLLTHYSTYLCPTPNELGQAEYFYSNECQSIPLNPTSCFFETNNDYQTLTFSLILNIFLTSLFTFR